MKNTPEYDYHKMFRRLFIGGAVLLLLAFNYIWLQEYISSNTGVINDYQGEEDILKNRPPAVAGLFYPAAGSPLNAALDTYLEGRVLKSGSAYPRILIVPHAGYKYSALVATSAYKELLPYKGKIRNVILVGPAHKVAFYGVALPSFKSFSTPLGKISVNQEMVNNIAENKDFSIYDLAHKEEHSIEVQLPFLQKVLSKFKIVPMVYGSVSPQVLAEVLAPYLQQPETMVIFSADMSHYLDYDSAKMLDNRTAELIKAGHPEVESHMSCGAIGVNAAVLLAKQYDLAPKLLDSANSGDVTGDKNSVVGYASWIFANNQTKPEPELSAIEKEEKNLQHFADDYGPALMAVVQKSLQDAASGKKYIPENDAFPDIMYNKGASFVTLNKKGRLRGCIGSLVPHNAIVRDVAANAYKAAMEDERFSPLKTEELEDIEAEISLLTDFEPIEFASETDLLSKIRPGKDGIVIRDGSRQGVFLPSVWKELSEKKEFLNHLKIKAGLSPNYWSDTLKAYRFYVVEVK